MGKLRGIMNEYKRIAHSEVTQLDSIFQGEIDKLVADAKKDAEDQAENLAKATEKMYEAMAEVQTKNIYANEESKGKITAYDTESKASIAATKADFDEQLDQMARVIASHYSKMKDQMQKLTGVVDDEVEAAESDRGLIRDHMKMFEGQMRSAIITAIKEGEAKAKAVEDRARANLAAEKQALLIEISNTVEDMADQIFKTIQQKTNVIADNYLSLKAYASVAKGAVTEMVSKGKGLVNEFTKVVDGVGSRFPYGLGHYMLMKAEAAMKVKGILKVDKIQGKAGNWVMVDSHTVGLSGKMDTFEGLAVRMNAYEAALAALTAKLSSKKPASITKPTPFH